MLITIVLHIVTAVLNCYVVSYVCTNTLSITTVTTHVCIHAKLKLYIYTV